MILKKVKKKRNIFKLITILLITIFFSYLIINYIGKKIIPFYTSYAESEVKKILTIVINHLVLDQLIEKMNTDILYQVTKNDKGEIQLIDFNNKEVISILDMITEEVQSNIKAIENNQTDKLGIESTYLAENEIENGVICQIPLGVFTNNPLLANIGPKIPVKMKLIGDVVSSIETDIKEYGINAALLEVTVKIEVTSKVVLPFVNKNIKIETELPVSTRIIQGTIPNYYIGGYSNNSNIVEKEVE
ncbi:MAG: sporulation protein YunB [bacterium]|nr:sporulation protein YunB [bacterium]